MDVSAESLEANDRDQRLNWSKADRLTRAAAVLLADRLWDTEGEDPCHRLRAVTADCYGYMWNPAELLVVN